MRKRKLKKLLKLWQTNELITETQVDNILEFMKERQKELFFKMIKWFIIIGTFCTVFGVIGTIINLMELDIFHKIALAIGKFFSTIWIFIVQYLIIPIHTYIIHPFCMFIDKLFGTNKQHFYIGSYSLIIVSILFYIGSKLEPKKEIEELNLSDEQKNVLKSNWVLDTLTCIFLTTTFMSYNEMLLPDLYTSTKIIPIWNMLGAVTFMVMAYGLKKNIYLIFSIYFISLSVGMFFGSSHACYWISASRPVIQILVAIILLLIGYISQLKLDLTKSTNTYLQEKFADTYNWTGLLMLFIALWIASFWGFGSDEIFASASNRELWFANILFILASVAAMYWGAKSEQKIFFNYGLTFLIIETYTILCGRLWSYLPVGFACLLFGSLLIGTGKLLQKIYLKKNIK